MIQRNLLLAIFLPAALLIVWLLLSAALIDLQRNQKRLLDQSVVSALLAEQGNFRVIESFEISPEDSAWVRAELLSLEGRRNAYLLLPSDSVDLDDLLVALPASADDGFNGHVDLLLFVDSYGELHRAVVLEDLPGGGVEGQLQWIPSAWMDQFSGLRMSNVKRMTWSRIGSDNEYDQFVGASLTPKAVVSRIYDALVFFQSNRLRWLERAKDVV